MVFALLQLIVAPMPKSVGQIAFVNRNEDVPLIRSKNKLASAVLALPTLLISNQDAIAADKTQEEPTVLEKVVVTDKRTDANTLTTTEITSAEISAKQAQVSDTAKLLEDIPGVSFQSAGGVSSLPIIHGLNDDRVKIDINGMTIPSACANHMNPPLSYIDRTNVGKITVMQGVTPVSMGGDSIGGTIVVESAAPVFAEPGKDILLNGKASAFYRSNGDAFGGSIAAGIANQNVRLDYTGSHTESMNYNDGNGNDVKSSVYENQNHAAGLSFKFDNHLVEIKGGQQHIPFQGFPNQRMDLTNNDSIFGNIRHKGTFDWGALESKLYLENTSHSMNYLDDKFNGPGSTMGMMGHMPLMPMETRARNLGYKVQAEIPLREQDTLRIGNEFHSNKTNDFWPPVPGTGMAPNTFVNLNNATRDRVGTFAEWEANWSSEWKTLLGLRYDHTNSDTGNVQAYKTSGDTVNALSGSDAARFASASVFNAKDHERNFDTFDVTALAQFTPNQLSQYEFGYSRKNRAPGLYELYPWSNSGMMMTMIGTFGDGNGYMGNLNLKNETAHNISFSANFHDPKNNAWEIKATPYISYVENFIDADRCTLANCGTVSNNGVGRFNYLTFGNHDARLWGADLSGRMDLFNDKTLGQFGTHTNMSYVRGERMDGGNLYHMMPFNLKLGLDHKLQGWKNLIEMQFVDGKDDVQQIRNELTTPSYILLNAKTGYQWKNLSIDVGLDNVLDKQYYHPLAGAYLGNYYAMSLPSNSTGIRSNTANVPGMGRSVFVGMTLTY